MEFSINMSDTDLPLQNTKVKKRTEKPQKVENPKKVKPPKVRKPFPWVKVIISIILVLILSAVGYFIYKGYKVSSDIGFQLTPGSILDNNKEPELKKDSTGKYTSVMLVGIDTRENSGLLNTDTIILATYSYDTKEVTMLSIPRDFHVQVNPDVYWFNRINSVYGTHEQKEKGSGLEALRDVVQEVTDREIQYYAMIDYNGFIQLIDAVGGVYVNVENSFTDYMYPANPSGYKTVKFESGPQLMDGATALEYSRSRHSLNNGEGSDYARARRQQNVIKSLKDTLLSSETLLNPKKIMDLMSAVQNNLKISDFTITDIEAGISLLKDYESLDKDIYSFVLDPNAGNGALVTSKNVVNTGAFAIGPVDGLGQYDDIQEYVKLINTDPQLYFENPLIYVYNTGLGYQDTYNKTQDLREEFKFLNIKYLGTLYSDKESTYVYSHDDQENTYSADKIAKFLELNQTEKPEYIKTNLNGEDITILMGKQPQEIITQEQ